MIRFLDNQKLSRFQMVLGLSFLSLFVGITGCGILNIFLSDTPESSASKYLQAWKDNNLIERKKLSCFPAEVINVPDFNIQSWDIIKTQENNKDIDSKYFTVFVKLNYNHNNNFIKRTIVFDIWNSEELFELGKRSVDKFNRKLEEIEGKLKPITEALGMTDNYERSPITLTRDNYSLERYCIRGVKIDF